MTLYFLLEIYNIDNIDNIDNCNVLYEHNSIVKSKLSQLDFIHYSLLI